MDPHSPKMHTPTISAYNFGEFGGSPTSIQGSQVQNPRTGQLLTFLTTQKKTPLQTIIIPYVHQRFILYKALSTPQTLIGKGGN